MIVQRVCSRPVMLKALALLGFGLSSLMPQAATAAEDFYKGKQIHLILGNDPGGAYDDYMRPISRHLGKHIPGQPSVVVQYMPGVAGLKLANYLYESAPRDGTVIGAVPNAIPTATLTNPKEAKFDPNKMTWIGSATREFFTGYVWKTSPVQNFEEARTKEVLMGGITIGSFSTDIGILAANFFDMKIRTILGYKSSPEVQLAVEKGEVNGVMATAYSNLKVARASWLANKDIKIIIQYGLTRNSLYPDVPTFMEFAKNDDQRKAILFEMGNLVHGKPYFAPPGIPADRVEILRRAFADTMKDPDFLKDIAAAGLIIDGPMNGEELAKFVAEETATPPAVLQYIHKVIDGYSAPNK